MSRSGRVDAGDGTVKSGDDAQFGRDAVMMLGCTDRTTWAAGNLALAAALGADGPAARAAERLPTASERLADAAVHATGIVAALAGAAWIIAAAGANASTVQIAALLTYSGASLIMLVASTAYNLAGVPRRRQLLRRFDHAGIFAMIAGTCTPFTVLGLQGAAAVGTTAAVWSVAIGGSIAALARPRLFARISIPTYLLFGSVGVIAVGPLLGHLDPGTVLLLATGIAVYVIGIAVHVWHDLRFQAALWHVFVLVAAGIHYIAIFNSLVDSHATLLAIATR
jgi:hemolysin III